MKYAIYFTWNDNFEDSINVDDIKDRDYWKELFEKEHETNKKLTDMVNKLTDYIGWII